jgi:hypothetical protein
LSHNGRIATFWRNSVTDSYTTAGVGPSAKVFTVPAYPTYPQQQAAFNLSGAFATGYARTRPGNPLADMAQFLVELRDFPVIPFTRGWKPVFQHVVGAARRVPLQRLPRILRQDLARFQPLGSEYLNVVFGWKPLLNDLRKMYYLWQELDKRLAQIVRENGRNIRRKATISDDVTTSQTSQAYGFAYANVLGSPPNYFDSGKSLYTVTTTTKTRLWFSGSYHYYIPDVGSSQWTQRATRALFGLNPTPSLLWEVMPWSWLIDYFGNMGDVISNMSPNAVDNLTLRYSFTMKHVTTRTDWQCQTSHEGKNIQAGPFGSVWGPCDFNFTSTEEVDTKLRFGGGNPFGFGVKLSSLSAGQLGILAALGLSRSSVV